VYLTSEDSKNNFVTFGGELGWVE